MTTTTGTCPACNGTARRPVPEDSQRYIKHNARWGHWGIAGYEPAGSGPFADGSGYEGGTRGRRQWRTQKWQTLSISEVAK